MCDFFEQSNTIQLPPSYLQAISKLSPSYLCPNSSPILSQLLHGSFTAVSQQNPITFLDVLLLQFFFVPLQRKIKRMRNYLLK